jgi:hypothetical protein
MRPESKVTTFASMFAAALSSCLWVKFDATQQFIRTIISCRADSYRRDQSVGCARTGTGSAGELDLRAADTAVEARHDSHDDLIGCYYRIGW